MKQPILIYFYIHSFCGQKIPNPPIVVSASAYHPFIFLHCNETMVLYMYSTFWLFGVESHDFSQAEKEIACKAEQIHKMTTIFTQNDNLGLLSENSFYFVNLHSFASSYLFLNMRKITWLNSQQSKTRGQVEHL